MSNVIKRITFSEELYALKIKNPIFNSYYAPHYRKAKAYENGDPVVTGFVPDGESLTEKGAFLFLDTTGRYFHDIMENIPLIVALLQAGEKFTVALAGYGELNPDTGLFKGMLGGDDDPGSHIFTQPCKYLLDFFECLEVPFICIPHQEIDDFSCEYAYIFYQKSHAPGWEDFETNHVDNPSEPLEYQILKSSKATYPLYNYPLLGRKEGIDTEYVVPKDLEPESGYFLRANSWYYGYEYYKESIRILRSYFPFYPVEPGKKVFLSRRNYGDRKVVSEDLLEQYFQDKGYGIVFLENYTPTQQLELMQRSEYIAGMVGSAFLNTIMCGPDNNILILKPHGEYELALFGETYELYGCKYRILPVENDSAAIVADLESLKVFI